MAKAKSSPDDQLTTEQVAAELGVSVSRVLILIKKNRLPATRFGWAWVVRRGDLAKLHIQRHGRPRKRPEDQKPEPKKKRT